MWRFFTSAMELSFYPNSIPFRVCNISEFAILVSLKVCNSSQLTSDESLLLGRALECLPSLVFLSFFSCTLNLKSLAPSLPLLRVVRLTLSRCNFTGSIQLFAENLRSLKTLEALKILSSGSLHFVSALDSHPSLLRLCLLTETTQPSDLESLVRFATTCPLQWLDLGRVEPNFSYKDWETFFSGLLSTKLDGFGYESPSSWLRQELGIFAKENNRVRIYDGPITSVKFY